MGVCLDLITHSHHDLDIWQIVIDNVLKSWLLWIWIIIIVPMICLRVVAHSHHDLDICMNYEHVIKSWSSSQWFAWEWWRPEAWQSHCSRPRLPPRGLRLPPSNHLSYLLFAFAFATFDTSAWVAFATFIFICYIQTLFTFTSKNDTFNHSLSHSETCFNKMFTTFHIFRCISIICYLRLQSSIFSHILFKSVTFRCIRNLGTWFDFSTYGR